MIYELYANNDNFKHIYFKRGLNIVLADSDKNCSENSRNGLGKTTLINILHFCFASQNYEDVLPVEQLKEWEFSITLDLFNEKITATRSLKNPSLIKVTGNFKDFPIEPEVDGKIRYYSLNDWKNILAQSLFGLDTNYKFKYNPSFRMLISYFVRRNIDIISSFENKSTSYRKIDKQISTSFLLGLDFRLVSAYKELTDEHSKLSEDYTYLKNNYGVKGRLIPEINHLKKEIESLNLELDNFKIHKSYDLIKKNADDLTGEIHDLVNETIVLDKKLKKYNESIKNEDISNDLDIESIYKEVNFYFPENVKNTLDKSQEFHKNIILNRKEFLKNEINSINNRLESINKSIDEKSSKKAEYMNILNNFGALREYNKLQSLYSDKKSKLNELNSIIDKYDEITSKRRVVKKELLELESKFQINYHENTNHLNKLINLFSDNSKALYDIAGNLIIDVNDKGFEFNIEIPRINSDGKSKIIIFCYDLMLLENFYKNHINFLIHDSNIFDGVDSRQYAGALNLINSKVQMEDMQYICMLNSDSIPDELLNFNVEDKTVLRLSDDSLKESLLGFEF